MTDTTLASNPSEQGVNPAGIARFLDAIEADPGIEPHGLIIQRHGRRIAEGHWQPHDGRRSRLLYSLSKTFTGTALALQIGEGRLSLDDLVSDHLPEAFDGAAPGLRGLRIRHIASMSSGHNRETMGEANALDPKDPVRGFLRIPPDAEPGTLFAYNQPPVITLATILQKLAGERLVDYLRPRLFDPLGIGDVRSQQLRPGIDLGYSGIHASLDTVARLGQLYLDDGVHDGRRLLPQGWVRQASQLQISNAQNTEPDWQQGYGFQLWVSRHGYRGDGAYGQYMVVLPEQDAMIAMVSCVANMQTVLDLMWMHLLPAMTDDGAPNASADQRLADRLASLKLPTAQARVGGGIVSPTRASFSAAPHGANSHRSITSISANGSSLTIREGEQSLEVPLSTAWTRDARDTIAVSAAQLGDGRIVVDLAMLDTPHRLEITLRPETRTFETRWLVQPLFGAGIGKRLASMHAP
ncbi:MAG TPA: serine hydrolase domain-containing protein [Pseudomonadales bacterium]|nr:serine hydrolase domain-containing protein [Pseudomonadales bacterium]